MSKQIVPLTPDRIESAMAAQLDVLTMLRRHYRTLSRRSEALAAEPDVLAAELSKSVRVIALVLAHVLKLRRHAESAMAPLDPEAEAWLRRQLDSLSDSPATDA